MSFVSSIFNFLRFNKKNWKAVVLCIVAATVFWFFIALNKNYSTNITFPVTFDYDTDHYIPVKPLPATVRMNVSGLGWNLFRKSSGLKVPPLVVPLENPADVKKIVGTTLPAIFASQLQGLQINFVITDTLRINIEEMVGRKFNVRIDSVKKYIHSDFGLTNPPRITPDTVWLEGPKQTMQSLPATIMVRLSQRNLKKNYEEDATLNLPSNLIKSNPSTIKVSLDVAKFVEINKKVKLEIVNVPARQKVSNAMVKEIHCTYRLPEAMAQTFSGDSLVAVINLKNKRQGSYRLVPQVLGLPLHANLVKADTVIINF